MNFNIPQGWTQEHNTLIRTFQCKDFDSAIDFVNKIAAQAQKYNHHPDICIHSYKKVRCTLTTHSKGQVTNKDLMLAQEINAQYATIIPNAL